MLFLSVSAPGYEPGRHWDFISMCFTKKMLQGQGDKKISVPLLRTNFKCRVTQCNYELADCGRKFIYIAIHRHEQTSFLLSAPGSLLRRLESCCRVGSLVFV